jgi:hypothetical protein
VRLCSPPLPFSSTHHLSGRISTPHQVLRKQRLDGSSHFEQSQTTISSRPSYFQQCGRESLNSLLRRKIHTSFRLAPFSSTIPNAFLSFSDPIRRLALEALVSLVRTSQPLSTSDEPSFILEEARYAILLLLLPPPPSSASSLSGVAGMLGVPSDSFLSLSLGLAREMMRELDPKRETTLPPRLLDLFLPAHRALYLFRARRTPSPPSSRLEEHMATSRTLPQYIPSPLRSTVLPRVVQSSSGRAWEDWACHPPTRQEALWALH